jgi:hypothetical protein
MFSEIRAKTLLSVMGVYVQDHVALAKKILIENTKVLYGIFGIIDTSAYFPPLVFLNEFFMVGNDPCDQDGRMECWNPFKLNEAEYSQVFLWWQSTRPESVVDNLNTADWSDWVQEILEN